VLVFEVLSRAKLPFAQFSNEELARKLGDASFSLPAALFGGVPVPADAASQHMWVKCWAVILINIYLKHEDSF
jgi:hypothetical protein